MDKTCDKCKYVEHVITASEHYIVCTNDNYNTSWPSVDAKDCEYYEEVKADDEC